MSRNSDRLHTTDSGDLHGISKRTPRRQRPMSRAQEITLLAVALAIGAGLQIAYLLSGTPALP